MKRQLLIMMVLVLSLSVAFVALAALKGNMIELKVGDEVYACQCGSGCDCDTISRQPGKCSCGKDLVKAKVTKVETGKAYLKADGWPEAKAFKTEGKYICSCPGGCNCDTISLKPGKCGCGMEQKPEKWDWHTNGGWRPNKFSFFNKIGMMYSGSSLRSRYFFEMLEQARGNIDLEYMITIYRTSGTMPEGDWNKISREYRKNGQWGAISGGNASNGIVGVMKPDNDNRGIYALCLGQPARGTAPTSPFFASFNPIYAETNAYWELTLAASPLAVAQTAGTSLRI